MKEESFGIIPVVKTEEGLKFLIVHQTNSNWSFPKGHKEGIETDEQTAKRELEEETGITEFSLLDSKIFEENYSFVKDGQVIIKRNQFFIGILSEEFPVEIQEKEIQAYKYATLEEAVATFNFPEPKQLLVEVNEYLKTRI